MKTILSIFGISILFSCSLPDEPRNQIGFTFDIRNKTGIIHENATLSIGGFKEGVFIATDTYIFPKIVYPEHPEWPDYGGDIQLFAVIERWNPNLDLIREIPSKEAYFKFKLNESREVILENAFYKRKTYNYPEILSSSVENGRIIKNDEGSLHISIYKDSIRASLKPGPKWELNQ